MKKELSKSFLLLKTSIKKHSPEILTGIGIAGMITTTVMAVRATPKALILIEERKEEIGVNQLEAVDLIKTTWMCYVPAALTGTLSTRNSLHLIGIGSQRLSGKSNRDVWREEKRSCKGCYCKRQS